MPERNVDISLQLPVLHHGPPMQKLSFVGVVKEYLEALDFIVEDTGVSADGFTAVGELDFVLHLAHNPWAQAAGGYIAMKALDATAGEAVKGVLNKLASAGTRGISGLYVELQKHAPLSYINIILRTPNHISYRIPKVDTEDAIRKIAYDIEKEGVWTADCTTFSRFDNYIYALRFDRGEWIDVRGNVRRREMNRENDVD